MVVNAYREQEKALLTQSIAFNYGKADICHAKGMLIAEKHYREEAQRLEKKLQAFKGFTVEVVEDPEEIRFGVE